MTEPLLSDRLELLLPVLRHLAEMIQKSNELSRDDLELLLLGIGLDEGWALDELQRWVKVLSSVRGSDNSKKHELAQRALIIRGVPEATAILAVSIVAEPNQRQADNTVHNLKVSMERLDFGILTSSQTATREFDVQGCPGRVTVESDQVRVTPLRFGNETTTIRVEITPITEGILWTTLKLITAYEMVELPILAQVTTLLSSQTTTSFRNGVASQQEKQLGNQEAASMESLLEEQGLGLDSPKQGEVRTGIIATFGENEILVSVGTRGEGVISGRELEQIPTEERQSFRVGMEIPVFVIIPEDANGNVVLSYMRAREEKDWEQAEELLSSAESFENKIIDFNKGGLLVPLGRLRGFVPASQISLVRRANLSGDTPDQRWGKMVGEPIRVRVIEVDRVRRRLILSERSALQETRESLKDRLLKGLKEGDIRKGRVTSVADFGAFVNIDGADGLVHLSEISWDRIQHPNEVLVIGQEVDVKVISIDNERKRIGLSIRRLQADPWLKRVAHLKEGMLIEGTITHLTKFGAFARLGEDLEGLIHISEMNQQQVNHPREVVQEGDVVTLKVIKVDLKHRRIGLSMRKVSDMEGILFRTIRKKLR